MGFVLPGFPILVLALAPGTLRFLGDQACPDNKEVQAEIRRLNPAVLEGTRRHLVLLQLSKDALEVRLFDEDGHLLEERVLRGPETCAGWARTAAVVLVTWEAELIGPAVPLPAFPVPEPAPKVAPPVASPRPFVPPEHHAHWLGEIGAGFIGSVASDGMAAPGAEVRASMGPAERRYGGQLTLLVLAPRTVSLAPGSASWERFAVGLGGHLTLGPQRLKVELDADALAGLLVSKGVGFSTTRTATAFDPGLMASARLGWFFGRWLIWLQVGGVAWLRAEHVQVFGGPSPPASAPIPQAEVLAILGLSLVAPL
jgi:hypothetical protein